MRCERFEGEALARLEQGLPLDEHFSTCPDCLEARAAYERLGTALAAAGDGLAPRDDWQGRVWERIEERRAARRPWRRWMWAAAPVAAAALVVLLVVWPQAPGTPELAVRVEAGPAVRRGDEARPGDRLLLEAMTGGAAYAELRVYRNDRELVVRCSDDPPCERRGAALTAVVVLDTIGTYQSVLLAASAPLPAATGRLDDDLAAVLDGGAQVELGAEIDVR